MKYGQEFNPYGLFTGLFIPNRVAQSYLSDSCKILLGRLYQYAGQNGLANPKRETLAKELSWNIRKLDRVIKELKDEGIIDTTRNDDERRHGKSSSYIFLYHEIYNHYQENPEKMRTVKNDRWGTVKNDSCLKGRRVKEKKKKGNNTFHQPAVEVTSPLKNKSNKKISMKAKQVYEELVDLGATNHRQGTLTKTRTLITITQLLKNSCSSPIPAKIAGELFDKGWTIDDLTECFEKYLLRKGKVKNIADFIYSAHAKPAYSPLCVAYQKIQKEKAEQFNFNGTAKRLLNLFIIHFGDVGNESPGVFIKAGKRVDKAQKTHIGNPSLMYPRDEFVYQFMLFVKEKANDTRFKIPYMCGKPFMRDFIKIAVQRGAIVSKGNVR